MASVSKVTQMAHQFARICVFGDVRVQFRQQARQQSHGLRRERPVWFGEQAALKSPSAGSKQDVNPLFAQQFVMAAGSHEHGGTIIANP